MAPRRKAVRNQRPGQPFSPEEITARKIVMRDVISSFERNLLPEEICPDAFNSIDANQQERDSSEWTRPDDFLGTLMQRGTYIDVLYQEMERILSPEQRAVYFWQKLARLFQDFDKYESPEDLEPDLEQSAKNLRRLEQAFQEDWKHRVVPPEIMSRRDDLQDAFLRAHKAFVGSLRVICERGSQEPFSLYENLIASPPAMQEPFGIVLLEQLAREQASVLPSLKEDLESFLLRLQALEAPAEYRRRLEAVLENVTTKTPSSAAGSTFRPFEPRSEDDDDDSDDHQGPSGPPTASARPVQAEPVTGKKRPAAQASGRRGRAKRGAA